MMGMPELARYRFLVPDWLPQPDDVIIANEVHGITDRPATGYTAVLADVSGVPLKDMLTPPVSASFCGRGPHVGSPCHAVMPESVVWIVGSSLWEFSSLQ